MTKNKNYIIFIMTPPPFQDNSGKCNYLHYKNMYFISQFIKRETFQIANNVK